PADCYWLPASLDLLFRETRCTRWRGSRSTPNLQRENRARPVDLAGRRFRAQPMRTAAPPRGLTAEHLAFNLPRAKRARLFMNARNGSPRISKRGSLAHQFEMLATSVRRCGPPPDFCAEWEGANASRVLRVRLAGNPNDRSSCQFYWPERRKSRPIIRRLMTSCFVMQSSRRRSSKCGSSAGAKKS